MKSITIASGTRFGSLVVLERVRGWRNEFRHKCLCDCGNHTLVPVAYLTSGRAHRCRDCGRKSGAKSIVTHGEGAKRNQTPEYKTWAGMKRRCEIPSDIGYHRYGGRGIKVCERWQDYSNFLADMGRKPTPKHTIEREDGNGAYEPRNCSWADRTAQARNTRSNRIVEFRGREMTLAEAAEIAGIGYSTAWQRLRRGVPIDWVRK